MVICTYFLTNTCRFGTKCNNEHVNVKLTLKTDAESTLKGNQWPLSCYGPFRDKPCIENFIEDQSFEEIRHLCYEAKQTGNVQNVTLQFTQSVNDAKNKMNMLTNPSNEVVSLVTNMYNNASGPGPANNNANPFGMNSAQQQSSIFGGGGGNNTNNNNLFGASTNSSNPFARTAAGFGTTQNQGNTNLFGAPSATTSSNPFGGAANTSTSLFGGSSFSANTGSSLFGGGGQTKPSVFGAAASGFGQPGFGQSNASSAGPFSQQPNSGGPFALTQIGAQATSQQSSIFGGSQPQNPVFGGAATFGNQMKPSGLFASAGSTFGQQPAANTNVFGQSMQGQGMQSQGMQGFGASAPQSNLFGGNAAAPTQNQSIFGGAQQTQDNPFAQVATQPTANIFGQPATSTSNSLFGGASSTNGNLFGNAQPQQQSQPQQSVFGGNTMTSNANSGSMFGQSQTAPSLQQQQQSIFGNSNYSATNPTSQPSQSVFGANSFQQATSQSQPLFGNPAQQQQQSLQQNPAMQPSASCYTPMSLLSKEEIEAFQSDSFDISKIPMNPPPIELCC